MIKKKVLFSGMQVLLSAAVVFGCQRPVAASSNFFEKILTLQAEEDNKENGEAEEMLSGKRLLEKQYFDAGGVLSGREICEYDDNGNMILSQSINIDENTGAEEISEFETYEYDDNNQVIVRCLYYDENELAGRYVYERDADGRIQTETLHVEDFISYTVVYAYDGQGNNISQTRYDKNGLLYSVINYTYDANGRIASAGFINYREDGSVRSSSTSVYEWSEDGSTLRIPWYYSGGESEGSLAGYDVTVYDEDGNVLENRSEDVNGIVQGKTVYIYE